MKNLILDQKMSRQDYWWDKILHLCYEVCTAQISRHLIYRKKHAYNFKDPDMPIIKYPLYKTAHVFKDFIDSGQRYISEN